MAVLLSILSLEWTEIRFENNQKKILSLINCYKLFYTANHPVTNHLVSFENRTQNFISSTSHPQNYD